MIEPYQILLVEDNEGDMILTMEALEGLHHQHLVARVKDGEQAIHYLKKEGLFHSAKLPDLILLDINLPRLDGKEVLSFIKQSALFRKIPVIILSTSNSERDIEECYLLGANCYVVKPSDLDGYVKVIHAIESFWLSIANLPENHKR
jgi:two-component system, chemotaxis family, response regulator Rcp1